jgi:hypothetical protein
MSEGPEVDTDRLHEVIHEELERDGGSFLRSIAVSTALFAALAAIASLYAGATANQALVLKTDATTLQARASDQWAYYQSRGIKAQIQMAAQAAWLAAAKTPPAALEQQRTRYVKEQDSISAAARKLEEERDAKTREADHLLHRHHAFANAVALLQVCIAVGAVAALTRNRPIWYGSLLVGVAGAVLFVLALST